METSLINGPSDINDTASTNDFTKVIKLKFDLQSALGSILKLMPPYDQIASRY